MSHDKQISDGRLENVKILLNSKLRTPVKLLTSTESKICYNTLIDNVNANKLGGEYVELLANYVLLCDEKYLCEVASPDSRFWNILCNNCEKLRPEVSVSNLVRLFNIVINLADTDEAITSVCRISTANPQIIGMLLQILSRRPIQVPLFKDTILCITLFLKCLLILCETSVSHAVEFVPAILLLLFQYKFPASIAELVYVEDLQPLILEQFVPLKQKLINFLSSVNIDDYSCSLKENLMRAINDHSVFQKGLEMEMGKLPSINLLNAYDTFTFLNSPNRSFKRLYTEQLLFGENDFPLYEAIFKLSDQFRRLFNLNGKQEGLHSYSEQGLELNVAITVLNRQTLFYKTLELFLRFWIESLAKSENDMVSLLNLAIITLRYVCLSSEDLESARKTKSLLKSQIETLDSMDYKLARDLQLDSIKKDHYRTWSSNIASFDTMLSGQVHDYVRHQRLLQLQKGIWVYAENPLNSEVGTPKVYFIIVSDNHASLLAREFETQTDELPYLFDNKILTSPSCEALANGRTKVVVLKHITSFKITELTTPSRGTGSNVYIKLNESNVYTEVDLKDRNDRTLLKFYLDTEEGKYIWVDGLKLISPSQHEDISNDTKEQIDTLFDLRKNVQMINLNVHPDTVVPAPKMNDEDEEFYDLETLKKVTENFYFD
ncbi:YLL007C [Saccharomyces arboricola H-6]|uniref:YLL007C n=1 Tax=Saccharomyces arboricola (strain H-6 / AS 2.3317 / CBS 10644) TaxID=1160507 RepID=J8PZF7_SACAR|nr:YLL007C [Saccharomyces arboricola H-6]